jgi:hypothetical protein
VLRARYVVATADAGVDGAPFGRVTSSVSSDNVSLFGSSYAYKTDYEKAMQKEMWTSSYKLCSTARYAPALLSVEWGIRELVELERVLDSAIGLLYANFPNVVAVQPTPDVLSDILQLRTKTAEVCRVLEIVNTDGAAVISAAVSAVNALRAERSFQSMASMHARANLYPQFFNNLIEFCIELRSSQTYALIQGRYTDGVARVSLSARVLEMSNFDAVDAAYAATIRMGGISSALEDALFNIHWEIWVMVKKIKELPVVSGPLLGFINAARTAASMLDGNHAVRLIRTLDGLERVVRQKTRLSWNNRHEKDFRKLYAGLGFARGGVAPMTTRVSALIDMVALFQEQSFQTHAAAASGLAFLAGDEPPVELVRKCAAFEAGIKDGVGFTYTDRAETWTSGGGGT